MPCVGSPCSSACTRLRAAASAIAGRAPARSSAARASASKSSGIFFMGGILPAAARMTGQARTKEEEMGKTIELTAADGHKLSAYRADPAGKPRGAIVVIQEIFGVNSHIKSVADGYAADGYVAIAPAMFDRVQKGFDVGYTPDDIAKGREVRGKVTTDMALKDAQAAINEAGKAGKVGIVGYCWGGFVAWMAANKLSGLTCSVP